MSGPGAQRHKEKLKTYRDLLIWQKSMILVTKVYNTSKKFPNDEAYGLTSQIRRCAISIPSNIAEGYGRNSTNEYIRGCKNNKPRGIAAYLARDLSGATCGKLGDFFGGVSGAAITVRYNKVAEQVAEDKRLKRKSGQDQESNI